MKEAEEDEQVEYSYYGTEDNEDESDEEVESSNVGMNTRGKKHNVNVITTQLN